MSRKLTLTWSARFVNRFPCPFVIAGVLVCASVSYAEVERYKDEASFSNRLIALGFSHLEENFEGHEWDAVRTTNLTQNVALSVLSKTITWSSAANQYWNYTGPTYITTNPNWARGEGWGLYDTVLATTIRIQTLEPIYGMGLWINTNPDFLDTGFLFPDHTVANDPGYVLPGLGAMYPGDNGGSGHRFIGILDTNGFTNLVITGTLQMNEENQLEGSAVFGMDDVTFAVAESFLPTPLEQWRTEHFASSVLTNSVQEALVWGDLADPDLDHVVNMIEYLFDGNPNLMDAPQTALSVDVIDPNGVPQLALSFNRRTNDTAVVYVPGITADYSTWYTGTGSLEEVSVVSYTDQFERVTLREVPGSITGSVRCGVVDVHRTSP